MHVARLPKPIPPLLPRPASRTPGRYATRIGRTPVPIPPLDPASGCETGGYDFPEETQGWQVCSPGAGSNFRMVRLPPLSGVAKGYHEGPRYLPHLIYVSGDDGGLYRGIRRGGEWELEPYQKGVRWGTAILDIAISPNGEHPLFALGDWFHGPVPLAVQLYRREEHADAWEVLPLAGMRDIDVESMDPTANELVDPRTGYAGLSLWNLGAPLSRILVARSPGSYLVIGAGNSSLVWDDVGDEGYVFRTNAEGRPLNLLFGVPSGDTITWYRKAIHHPDETLTGPIHPTKVDLVKAQWTDTPWYPSPNDHPAIAAGNPYVTIGMGGICLVDQGATHAGRGPGANHSLLLTVRYVLHNGPYSSSWYSNRAAMLSAVVRVSVSYEPGGATAPAVEIDHISRTPLVVINRKLRKTTKDLFTAPFENVLQLDIPQAHDPELTTICAWSTQSGVEWVAGLRSFSPRGKEEVEPSYLLPKAVHGKCSSDGSVCELALEHLAVPGYHPVNDPSMSAAEKFTIPTPLPLTFVNGTPGERKNPELVQLDWVEASESGTVFGASLRGGDVWYRASWGLWYRSTYLRGTLFPRLDSTEIDKHAVPPASEASPNGWGIRAFVPIGDLSQLTDRVMAIGCEVQESFEDGDLAVRFSIAPTPEVDEEVGKALTTALFAYNNGRLVGLPVWGPTGKDSGAQWTYGLLGLAPVRQVAKKLKLGSGAFQLMAEVIVRAAKGRAKLTLRVGSSSTPSALVEYGAAPGAIGPLAPFSYDSSKQAWAGMLGIFEGEAAPDGSLVVTINATNVLMSLNPEYRFGPSPLFAQAGYPAAQNALLNKYVWFRPNMSRADAWWNTERTKSLSVRTDRLAVADGGADSSSTRVAVASGSGDLYLSENEGQTFAPIGSNRYEPAPWALAPGRPRFRSRGLELMYTHDILPYRFELHPGKVLDMLLLSTDDGGLFVSDGAAAPEGPRFFHAQPFVDAVPTEANADQLAYADAAKANGAGGTMPYNANAVITECTVLAMRGRDNIAEELFAGSTAGDLPDRGKVLVSRDGGLNWTSRAYSGLPPGPVWGLANAVAYDTNQPTGVMYAGVQGKGAYYLRPNSTSWKSTGAFVDAVGEVVESPQVTRIVALPGMLFAAVTIGGRPYSHVARNPGSALDEVDKQNITQDEKPHVRIQRRHRQAGLYRLRVTPTGEPSASAWEQVTGLGLPGTKETNRYPQVWRAIRDIAASSDHRLAVSAMSVEIPPFARGVEIVGQNGKLLGVGNIFTEGGVFTCGQPGADVPIFEPVVIQPMPSTIAFDPQHPDRLVIGLSEYTGFEKDRWCNPGAKVPRTVPFDSVNNDVAPFGDNTLEKAQADAAVTGADVPTAYPANYMLIEAALVRGVDTYFCPPCDPTTPYAKLPAPGLFVFTLSAGTWSPSKSLLGPPLSEATRRYNRLVFDEDWLYVGLAGAGTYRLPRSEVSS